MVLALGLLVLLRRIKDLRLRLANELDVILCLFDWKLDLTSTRSGSNRMLQELG